MQRMIIAVLLCLLSLTNLEAHNPLTAKFELRASLEEGALLYVYLTQVSVHYALRKQHPDLDFDQVNADEYKRMVVQYLRAHIVLVADNIPLELGYGAIKLGSHQTDLRFYIENYPGQVEKLEVHLNAFQENGHQQTVFWWYTPEESSKVVLSAENGFREVFDTAEEMRAADLSSVATTEQKLTLHWKMAIAFSLLVMLIFVFVKSRFSYQDIR